ncbi:MAG: HD-GYP domain-containing protein [Oscillospiraceae bacterium]|nr:HD-GYP domain-containing protein [Oscillospiraceae bacterium]
MLTNIYQTAGITAMFMLTMILSRYIFLLPTFKNWFNQWGFLLLAWIICNGACFFFGAPVSRAVLGVMLAAYIFLTGSGKLYRILRMAQVIPIMGIAYGIFFPPLDIAAMLINVHGKYAEIYGCAMFVILMIGLSVFAYCGKRWRYVFQPDLETRHLENWERTMLFVIGTMMFFFASTISTFRQIKDPAYQSVILYSCCVTSIISFTITLTIIILILQGNRRAHFEGQYMQMQHNIIITMADIVENRDENTGGHIRRTAKYVEIIARRLKEADLYNHILTEQYIADMITAAPLHDIGKIHIPDAVLKKPGRFTDEEYNIMKEHTTAGKRLLQQAEGNLGESGYLDIAIQMAGYHHEWWNGKGYPEGLRGQAIPLCARIMAVADVFDAIVSHRCYKGAMSIDEAFNLIRQDSGTHFDPVIVETFLEVRDEITAVAQEFAEDPDAAQTGRIHEAPPPITVSGAAALPTPEKNGERKLVSVQSSES